MNGDGVRKQRQRLRIACDPCRERKRKCDGAHPCDLCRGYNYECTYRSTPRSRRPHGTSDRPQPLVGSAAHIRQSSASLPEHAPEHGRQQPHELSESHQTPGTSSLAQPAESNSCAAFARSLTMALDPNVKEIPPMRMLAWNLYLGERQPLFGKQCERLGAILTEVEMRHLADIYFEKVHPCYAFVDQSLLYQKITGFWHGTGIETHVTVLCGVAALGNLFSDAADLDTERSLVLLAKTLLEDSKPEPPSLAKVTAWVLRTVYLRLTANPEEAWLASCTSLHMIDAAGLSGGQERYSTFKPSPDPSELRMGRRVFGIAQHMNIWMSYDLGRYRVVLPGFEPTHPPTQSGEYTAELTGLLPYTEDLDPGKDTSAENLAKALVEVLDRTHTQPPSVLAQCNLMLCIYRRLRASKSCVPTELLDRIILLMRKSLEAVRGAMAAGLPWHHVASMPFQVVCMLLAIDNADSFAVLGDSLACLVAVNDAYRTAATREAVTAAHALLQLHQKRREIEVKKHSEMLNLYPIVPALDVELTGDLWSDFTFLDSWWYNEFNEWDFDGNQVIQTS